MDLFHIQHNLIADRSADAWYATNIAGPFFHYRWQYGTSGGEGTATSSANTTATPSCGRNPVSP